METFTLFVLLATNICGPIPPIAQNHACGMPRPTTSGVSKEECEQKRQETLKTGAHAYCVSDTREAFTLVLWLAEGRSHDRQARSAHPAALQGALRGYAAIPPEEGPGAGWRSEEDTSELPSL